MKQNVTSKYDEHEVLNSLTKKKSLQIDQSRKAITIKPKRSDEDTSDIGIKTKGKLDFLRKYRGWVVSAQ
jgi:hypothetical protein